MKYIFSVVIFVQCSLILAQTPDSFYNYLTLGNYDVGFTNTLIFDTNINYNQYGYQGAAPVFLQIWHPLKKTNNSKDYLTWGELRTPDLPPALKPVYKELCNAMDLSAIDYYIIEDILEYEVIDYGDETHENILNTIKKTPTKSINKSFDNPSSFPVIIYHHGAQGLSDENYIMAEYFASRGFIFVSANYHLPYENFTYGFSPGVEEYKFTTQKIVTQYARSLTQNDTLFFIGHSMGAQAGFSYLYDDKWANAFVSMETTLEFYDSVKTKETWPELSETMNKHYQDYSIPILMFASTGEIDGVDFSFFNRINHAPVIQASSKSDIEHESYTSSFLLRYLYRDLFPQPDTKEMGNQLHLFVNHLDLISAFFQSYKQNKHMDTKQYDQFYFSIKNLND